MELFEPIDLRPSSQDVLLRVTRLSKSNERQRQSDREVMRLI
jgi:hypothetical protein